MFESISFLYLKLRPGCILAALLLAGSVCAPAQTMVPTAAKATASPAQQDGSGAYATGHYRNLFAEDGHPQGEIQAKIDAAYAQLFHGDPQTQSVVFAAGSNGNGPLLYLTDWNSGDVRTEGMSYGMMIAVQLNKKSDFDGLWNWAKTYMYIADPKHPAYRFFSWSCKTNGTANFESPAPDGEEYFAMALLFAANRWPGGHGIYDYRAEALQLLSAMRHRARISGPAKFGTHTIGPEMDETNAMILFVPEITDHPFTDPSYHLPAFYELWARWGPAEDRAFWQRAAESSRAFFVKSTDPRTGLAPSYANFDGSPRVTRFPLSGVFGYDAWRTASNWSVDWSWWHKAPAEQQLSDRIQHFFAAQGIDSYAPLYTLDGKSIAPEAKATPVNHPTGLIATNAAASLAATDRTTAKRFTEALWNAPIPSGQERYYDGMLYLMNMLHLSGEFRIWAPQ